MIFNAHSDLEGQHALFSASKYHWIRYDENKLIETFLRAMAVQKGEELHDFACRAIRLGQKLEKSKKTLNMYVNDAIGFKMTPEQKLVYSYNFFGTADAICFRKKILRIHDYKSGLIPCHMDQLLVYAALFFLEYKISPSEVDDVELRIYQNDEILYHHPEVDEIVPVMDKIITFDKIINRIKLEEV